MQTVLQENLVSAFREALGSTVAHWMEQSGVGVICVDRSSQVVATNVHADAILQQQDDLKINGGFLRLRSEPDNERLARLLTAALRTLPVEAVSGSLMLNRTGWDRFAVHVCPVRYDNGSANAQPADAVAVMILIVDPAKRPHVNSERVCATLGLTPTEGRVAAALAQGHTVKDIAAATSRAESTVRWTVKRVHMKLGTTRQADIVRLVLVAAAAILPLPDALAEGVDTISPPGRSIRRKSGKAVSPLKQDATTAPEPDQPGASISTT